MKNYIAGVGAMLFIALISIQPVKDYVVVSLNTVVLESEVQAKSYQTKQLAGLKEVKRENGSASSKIVGTKQDWLKQSGINESEWALVDYLVSKESGWRHDVWNGTGSGAYGLCQSLPASKMASAGSDYMTNPVTQLKWCNSYAQARYGGWAGAWEFWSNNNWW